ncbi:serine-type D-Ala-D-Ala carboxypeptidase [Vibrio sp. S4M6]|uniref:serine-type D-Ala-D-Ala carboxypeptidase n=1 Tax=Vibrio sinus TaxID=2946865 RepID=UPI00202A8771|nr:serine-type D-Ala-D-Ala carboxypeptidase [Vibrio sinus]MCL9781084.1 serine-type D-Ala-D-Ala carboxypeptidase [Vibrio sinus]
MPLNRTLRRCHFSTFVFFISVFFSANSFAALPSDPLPLGARSTLIVQDLKTGKVLMQSGSNEDFFPPASTLKLITALAAKLELGNHFRFHTSLIKSGNDLVFNFSGDPTLTSQDLNAMVKQIAKDGIQTIKGDIWLNGSAFNGYERAIGWPWDILGVCYSAPPSAINLDENCVQASISTPNPTPYSTKTRVYVPEHLPIHVANKVVAVSKQEQEDTHCALELLTSSNNHYTLKGCVVKRKNAIPLKFAVQQPELYVTRMIYTMLKKQGIRLDGQIKIGKPAIKNSRLIASHQSKRLPELLEVMLKQSDNLIADTLTKTIGAKYYQQPGSFNNGTAAIKAIILEHTGINLEHDQLVDGSGLSRNDRITRANMTDILRYIWQHNNQLELIDIMPVSGQSGTLQYRKSMRKAPIKGNIIAKSGSVYGTYNMAGFGLDRQGKPRTLFVQYVADYFVKKDKNGKKTASPITRFEQSFYKEVVKLSRSAQP